MMMKLLVQIGLRAGWAVPPSVPLPVPPLKSPVPPAPPSPLTPFLLPTPFPSLTSMSSPTSKVPAHVEGAGWPLRQFYTPGREARREAILHMQLDRFMEVCQRLFVGATLCAAVL